MALSPTYISRPAHEETINDPAVRRHYWSVAGFALEPMSAVASAVAALSWLGILFQNGSTPHVHDGEQVAAESDRIGQHQAGDRL